MADPRTIRLAGSKTATQSYELAPGLAQYVQSVYVEVDNTAGGDARPTLTLSEQAGVVIAKKRQGETIPAGDTGSATWALRLTDEQATTGGSGWQFDTDNEGGSGYVQTNDCTDLDTLPDPLAVGGTIGLAFEDDSGCGLLIGANHAQTLIKARGDDVTVLADKAGVGGAGNIRLRTNGGDLVVTLEAVATAVRILDHLAASILEVDEGRTVTFGAAVAIDAGANKITNASDPVAAQDLATKAYVLSVATGGGIPQGGPMTADLDADGFNIENVPRVANAGNIELDSDTGTVNVNAATDVQLFAGTGGVGIFGELGIDCNPSSGSFTIRDLTAGQTFTIFDSGNAPIFEVREDGSVHIPTGTAVIADL